MSRKSKGNCAYCGKWFEKATPSVTCSRNCSAKLSWDKRGRKNEQEEVLFQGVRFRRALPHGRYYWGRWEGRHESLHRAVWIFHKGPIPEGMVIHHRDEDTTNNDITNLDCISYPDHGKEHRDKWRTPERLEHLERIRDKTKEWHASEDGRRWHQEHGRESFSKREPKTFLCDCCGKEFLSRCYGSKGSGRYCSSRCGERKRGPYRVSKTCPVCKKDFLGSPRVECCSRMCGARLRWQRAGVQPESQGSP